MTAGGQVARGEMDVAAATGRMPALRQVGGACSCSKSVRWIYDDPLAASTLTAGASLATPAIVPAGQAVA